MAKEKHEAEAPQAPGQGVIEWYEALISALVVMVLLFSFFFRIIQVDGASMNPTLWDGDKLIVWGAGYTPKRGDIVIVDDYTTYGKPLVKRVIAKAATPSPSTILPAPSPSTAKCCRKIISLSPPIWAMTWSFPIPYPKESCS